MVATLVRLKATILLRTLQRDGWRLFVLVLGLIWALSALPSVIGGMVWLSGQSADIGHDVLVVAGTLLVLGWAVVPVLVPGLDDSLDIHRFATFGVPVRRLTPALLVASLLSVPTLFTALLCLAPMIVWGRLGGWPAALVSAVAAPLALATCVLASRLSTGVAERLLGSRRSRELGAVLGLLVAGLAVPAVLWLGSLGLEGVLETVPTAARVLGWTPFGAAWAAPAALVQGDAVGAVARLAAAGAFVAAGMLVWTWLLRLALLRPPTRGGQVRRRVDAILPSRHRTVRPGAIAAAAVTRRALRYWAADPRYLSAALAAVVTPVVLVLLLATVIDAPAAVALSMGPLMAGTIGWGRHNDVAFDGSAFWLHVAARVPGRADRLGRAAATLVWAAPVTVVVSILGAMAAGRQDLAVAAVGAGLGVLCAGLAASAAFSALLPYPVPAPGQSPFTAQMGAVGASLVAQLVTSTVTLVLSAPVLAAYAAALWSGPGFAVPTLLLGVAGGAATLAAGIVVGGRVYEARASRLLVRLG